LLAIGVVFHLAPAEIGVLVVVPVLVDCWVLALETREMAIGDTWIAWKNVVRRHSWSLHAPSEISVASVSSAFVSIRVRHAGSGTTVGHRIDLRVPGSRSALMHLLGYAVPPEHA
jgi:hypothetical protein